MHRVSRRVKAMNMDVQLLLSTSVVSDNRDIIDSPAKERSSSKSSLSSDSSNEGANVGVEALEDENVEEAEGEQGVERDMS